MTFTILLQNDVFVRSCMCCKVFQRYYCKTLKQKKQLHSKVLNFDCESSCFSSSFSTSFSRSVSAEDSLSNQVKVNKHTPIKTIKF